MPNRIQMISDILEMTFLYMVNAFLFIAINTVMGIITFTLTFIYTVGRIKRDVDKYHNGSTKDYFLFLIGRLKKK